MEKTIEFQTKCGSVKGYQRNGVYRFLGIPFAENPQKFKRSVELKKFAHPIDAKENQGSCYQFGGNFDGDTTPNQGEDCLYLNIFTKDNIKKKPVFVWIHGGGFMTGCSYYPMYDGTNFANHDIVYVSINYHLGILGFWDFRKLGEEFESNAGISDQLTALKWIKHNISSFGGDPDNVTICGESAGGISVLYLLSSPSSKGLFNKAISESDLPYSTFDEKAEDIYTNAFLKNCGISSLNKEKLFEYTVEELAKLMAKTNEEVSKNYPGYTIPAAVEDDLIPYDVLEGSKKKINKDVKLLI